jgi:hypothetical protein
VRSFFASLNHLSKKTLLNYHVGLSALWTWAIEEGLVEHHIIKKLKRPKPEDSAIKPYTREDIEAMLAACSHSQSRTLRSIRNHRRARVTALRDRAIILALLVYSILEMKCRRQGLGVTGEKVLKSFAYLAAIYTRFVDGSVQLRVEDLNPFQRNVVKALGQSWWPTLPGCLCPTLPEQQVVLRPRWEKTPLPPLS